MSDIWCVNGKTWYSKELVDKVIELCEKNKVHCETSDNSTICACNKLAGDILALLQSSEGR